MPRGYRLLGAAALGIVVIIALATGAYFGALHATYNSNHSKEAAYSTGNSEQGNPSQIYRDRAGLPDFAERIASAPDPKDADEREKRDLAAQEASALWAFWMLLATAFSALITMIGTGFLLWQIMLTREAVQETGQATTAMQEANSIAREANRPWITVKINVKKMYRVDEQFHWDFDIICENIGKTIAVDYCRFFHVVIRKPHGNTDIESWYQSDDPDRVEERGVILPSETIVRAGGCGVLDSNNIWSIFSTQILMGMEIIIGVDVFYKSFSKDKWYQTRRSFRVSKCLGDGTEECFLPSDILITEFAVNDWGVGFAK